MDYGRTIRRLSDWVQCTDFHLDFPGIIWLDQVDHTLFHQVLYLMTSASVKFSAVPLALLFDMGSVEILGAMDVNTVNPILEARAQSTNS